MIRLEHISVTFDGVRILNDLSCTIKTGECITIVGPNGSGKSTLFKVIAGTVLPNAGTIFIDNIDCTKLLARHRAPLIGSLLQDVRANTVDTFTVAENFALALLKRERASFRASLANIQKESQIHKILESLRLSHVINQEMRSLSGGQRQLIAFLMVTLVPPRILLLDEPTAALDPKAASTFLEFARTFITRHKITTLLITHDADLAANFSKKRWHIESGNIITNN